MSTSPKYLESRHRSAGYGYRDEISKKQLAKCKDLKDTAKLFAVSAAERCINCKFHSLKLVLFAVICGTILTFLYFPAIYPSENLLNHSSRFIEVRWIWKRATTDSRYLSDIEINWSHIPQAIRKLSGSKATLNIGILNFNTTEVNYWKQLLPHAETSVIDLDYADRSLTWSDLYPEWIDEEGENEVPACPQLPNPKVKQGTKIDLIAVKLPSPKKNWSRDVARLHLQLTAAKIAVDYGDNAVNVLFFTKYFPIPNIFPCNNLVQRKGELWLYKPDLETLKEKLKLPVGSCELALPQDADKIVIRPASREAYVTILHSANEYVCGAIAAAQSIRMSGSSRDLVILVDDRISDHHRSGLELAGWKVRTIGRIRNPKAEPDSYNEWNYSKFRLWQLTDYSKLIFMDADLLIFRNIDALFYLPEISATGNNATLFNSGVMVVEPSNCTFNLLMEHINEIESYNGGDQGYLNEIFTWWHRVPKRMNFLKHFWIGDEEEVKEKKRKLFAAEPPELHVLHYLGLKPWMCYRDYDCNWDVEDMREFASDEAHEKWWRVHDAMDEKLKKFCLLESRRKAGIEWNRRQAAAAKFEDEHWRWKIEDERMGVCIDEYCDWEGMLEHWGETNWTWTDVHGGGGGIGGGAVPGNIVLPARRL